MLNKKVYTEAYFIINEMSEKMRSFGYLGKIKDEQIKM